MEQIWSAASRRIGIVALGAAMTCAGAAVGQKPAPAVPVKPAVVPPKQQQKQPPPQVRPVQQPPNQQLPGQRRPNQQLPGQRQPNQQLPVQQPPNRQLPGQRQPNQQLPGLRQQNPAPRVSIHSPNLPVGKTVTPKGYIDVRRDGTKIEYANNRPVAMSKPGLAAKYGANGRPSMVRAEGPAGAVQVVHRGPGGIRLAEGTHPVPGGGQLRVVGTGPKNGFQERPVPGRPGFIRRSGMDGDRRYAAIYRGYHYNNVVFYRPVPAMIYAPAYYGWAVQSWGSPVAIQVGFAQQPWYSAYGGTFVAYRRYQSPDQWMTDQILAQNMQQAYSAGLQAGQAQGGPQTAGADVPLPPPAISPELKQQFDAQVKQEILEQGQQAQGGPGAVDPPPATKNEPDEMPDALKPGHVVFRVVATLDVQSNGEDCSLNADDWIIRNGEMSKDGTVPVTVAASRSSDCAQGATTQVALNDLMTMENEQDQQIQNAMKMASLSMGKGGMPAGPPLGAVPVPGGQAQPDTDVAANLQKEQVDANAAEAQATAPPPTAGGQ